MVHFANEEDRLVVSGLCKEEEPREVADVFLEIESRMPADFEIGVRASLDYQFPEFLEALTIRGWRMVPPDFSSPVLHYIYRNPELVPPMADYVYHGTSAAFHGSIQESGLDGSRNETINPGHMRASVCYETEYGSAVAFAAQTARKVQEGAGNPALVSGGDELKGQGIVYRWKLDTPIQLGNIGTTNAIDTNQLEFTLDGTSWYPAAKVDLSFERGDIQVSSSEARVSIQVSKIIKNDASCYHGNITGKETAGLLKGKPSGSYLIGDSQSSPGKFAMSYVNHEGDIKRVFVDLGKIAKSYREGEAVNSESISQRLSVKDSPLDKPISPIKSQSFKKKFLGKMKKMQSKSPEKGGGKKEEMEQTEEKASTFKK